VRCDDELARAERLNVKLVTWVDAAYPAVLKEIADPSLVLYVAGDPAALSGTGVAVIGTRQATVYGRETARRFGFQLAAAGYVVVSGLARGIDTEAHSGALQAKGLTVAVLGGALDRIFPAENEGLAREIVAAGGALVSEYPFGRQPDRQTFPMRNRIVSGLSRGVVVVEAPLNSGTMITVGQALDQNRSVMAVPGRVDSPNAAGCHRLLREGARLVTCADDVADELQELLPCPARRNATAATQSSPAASADEARTPQPVLTDDERRVVGLLDEERHVDFLIRSSGLAASRVNSLLVGLQLRRMVHLLPGGIVKRVEREHVLRQ
jgi:DNA processing protein